MNVTNVLMQFPFLFADGFTKAAGIFVSRSVIGKFVSLVFEQVWTQFLGEMKDPFMWLHRAGIIYRKLDVN